MSKDIIRVFPAFIFQIILWDLAVESEIISHRIDNSDIGAYPLNFTAKSFYREMTPIRAVIKCYANLQIQIKNTFLFQKHIIIHRLWRFLDVLGEIFFKETAPVFQFQPAIYAQISRARYGQKERIRDRIFAKNKTSRTGKQMIKVVDIIIG